jgi:hypothetical protein
MEAFRKEYKSRPKVVLKVASLIVLGIVVTSSTLRKGGSSPSKSSSETNSSQSLVALPNEASYVDPGGFASPFSGQKTPSAPSPFPGLRSSLQLSMDALSNTATTGKTDELKVRQLGGTASIPILQPTSITFSDASVDPVVTYSPGDLSSNQLGLTVSKGLKVKLIASSRKRITYDGTGEKSLVPFHVLPDFGATYNDTRGWNKDGWIYVSNSEVRKPQNQGGVGALTFDKNGNVIDYKMVLKGTTANCGGGRTPWGSWISCEETLQGKIWQVDPTGRREPSRITLGQDGGNFESFAFDKRKSHFFVTEDLATGPVRRFIPASVVDGSTNCWEALHGKGETTYLRLIPSSDQAGSYEWIKNKDSACLNTKAFYPNAEGIDVSGRELYFVSKVLKTMFTLNLDKGTYTSQSTRQGKFDGQPDQIQRIVGGGSGLLYFTEDGGTLAGIHARNRHGQFYSILESQRYAGDETTGLAFSPDGMHMYFAYQRNGLLFDITRSDGLRFDGETLNIKYHALNAN